MKKPRRSLLERFRGWLYRRGHHFGPESFWYSPSEAIVETMSEVIPTTHIVRGGFEEHLDNKINPEY